MELADIIKSIENDGRLKSRIPTTLERRSFQHSDVSLSESHVASATDRPLSQVLRQKSRRLAFIVYRLPLIGYPINILSYLIRLPTHIRKINQELTQLRQIITELERRIPRQK